MHIRIISGELRGKKLFSVPGMMTRPTADRVRESIFNILGSRVRHARVLDLFAGTGVLGIEALSRGAECALFIDHHPKPISVIKKNLASCRYESHSKVLQMDLCKKGAGLNAFQPKFQLAFMDPPYDRHLIGPVLSRLHEGAVLEAGALVVAEHGAAAPSFESVTPFFLKDQRKYGKTLVSFFDYVL
jgi:16S rRNA (guanine966-N2)-methyltransferase